MFLCVFLIIIFYTLSTSEAVLWYKLLFDGYSNCKTVIVVVREKESEDREELKKVNEISGRNITLDNAWHYILINTAVIHSVIRGGNGVHGSPVLQNVIVKPRTRSTVSYRKCFPKI